MGFRRHPPTSGPGMPVTSSILFGMLKGALPRVAWTVDDERLSDQMMSYWSNFARTGDPNGSGLPAWPKYQTTDREVQHLDVAIRSATDTARPRYLALDAYMATAKGRQ